jgi:hypothetical protein
MKSLVSCLTLFVLLISGSLNAQILSDTSAQAIAYWRKGDSRKYRLTKSREEVRPDKPTKNTQSDFIVSVAVIDSTESSYRIRWQTKVDTSSPLNQELLANPFGVSLVESLLGKTSLEIETDENGSFSDWVNYEKVIPEINSAMEDMMRLSGKITDTERGQIMSAVKRMYGTKEAATAAFLPEPSAFLGMYGIQLSTGSPLSGSVEIPNPITNSPTEASQQISLDQVDLRKDLYTVSVITTVDSSAAKKAVMAFINSAKSTPAGANEEMANTLSSIRMIMRLRGTFEGSSGWPISIDFERATTLGSQERRVDRLIFSLID